MKYELAAAIRDLSQGLQESGHPIGARHFNDDGLKDNPAEIVVAARKALSTHRWVAEHAKKDNAQAA